MVAFAVGGLLGDTIFHLLPEIFLGEDSPEHVRFVLVEPNRNLLLGVAILIGFVTFVAMDKGLRIATGGGHAHAHDHRSSSGADDTTAYASGVDAVKSNGGSLARKRDPKGVDMKVEKDEKQTKKDINTSVKLGGYLNLMQVLAEEPMSTDLSRGLTI